MSALMVLFLRDHGVMTMISASDPNLSASNSQLFDANPACLIWLRPLLPADYGT